MAPVSTNTRRFPPTEPPPHVRQINDSVFEDNCMLEPSLFRQRKRARSEKYSGQQNEASPPTKRRKASPSSETPAAFWDHLSKNSLTKRALKELNRRNTQAVPNASRTLQKQSSIACERGGAEYLRSHDPRILKAWKTFSRHGGPDLADLSRQVRTELGGRIIPSTQHDLPMLPNFFLAAKGPDGSLAVAGRQACYDAALGARGMESLQSYGQGESDRGSAYVISSIYHGGQLKIYTSHMTQPSSPRGRPEYHMNQLRSFAMTDTADTFRKGAGAYRNLREWTKEQRDDLIRRANETAVPPEIETSANDDEASASPALSFVTAASETEAYTMSQESRTTLNGGSNILGIFEESDSSIETLADTGVAAKQSKKRKRRSTNAGSEAQLPAD
jgi:hypothetical protein